jgi:hypothetical protein
VDVAVSTSGEQQLGSAAQEAARLFAAVEDWARTRGEAPGGEHSAGSGASTCGVCPVCSGIALLRDVRPETVEHLLDAAASVVAAVRSAVVVPPADGAPPSGGRPGGVQHIDVRED